MNQYQHFENQNIAPQNFNPVESTPSNKPNFLLIICAAIIFFTLIVVAFYLGRMSASKPKNEVNLKPTEKACTMEAKICPDGSFVGRTGPNCEFAPCPAGSK